MREILFRGKRIDNGEWIYGLPAYYETNKDEKGVITGIEFDPGSVDKIIPETLGQFTNMIDSENVRIFEGDRLESFTQQVNYWVEFHQGEFAVFNQWGYWGSLQRYFEVCDKFNHAALVCSNIFDHETA